jgi:Tol biopolymer transport system component
MKIMKQKHIIIVAILLLTLLSACGSSGATESPPPSSEPGGITAPTASSPALPAWAGRSYTGRLLLILFSKSGNVLSEVNLATGEAKILFQAPENSWMAGAVYSPDKQQILLTYGPPPPAGKPQFGYSDLYLLPASGGSSPKVLLKRQYDRESFFNPAWAPDGQSIYYTHLFPVDPNSIVPAVQNNIEQATLNGEAQVVVKNALWPALSPDGTSLAYLNADPITSGNDLYLAKADGSNPTPLTRPGIDLPVDDHFFTQDGSQIIFSMVNPQTPPSSSRWEDFLGIETASAHTVPSDWYTLPPSGGEPQQMTHLNMIGLNGALSPDGRRIAFISSTGLFIMNADGSDPFTLSNQPYVGSVDWIP